MNSLRYSTVPISKVKNISFELVPVKVENKLPDIYTIRLKILYGLDNHIYQYVTSVDRFEEILKLKGEINKLICK